MSRNFPAWIERRGQKLRCFLDLAPTEPLNPYQLAQTMGIQVLSPYDIHGLCSSILDHLLIEDSDGWSAGTLPLPNEKFAIVLNPKHAETRKRATLMEEISHVFLGHKPSNLIVIKGQVAIRSCIKSQEDQAYGVGAAALVPLELLQHAQSNLMKRDNLAHYCGVSVALINFREKVTGVRLDN